MHRPASPALSTCSTTTTTTTICHYYYKMGACDRVRKRCARQVFVEMLLRGLFSSGTSPTPTLLLTFPQSISRGGAAATATAFRSAVFCTVPASDDHEGMEKNDKNGHNDDHKKEDSTEHSFGVGYVTRSDEEGFGGVYGGNDDPLENSDHHENHPEYDKSQGSEVKEKEKARNLPEGASATSNSRDQRAAAAEKN